MKQVIPDSKSAVNSLRPLLEREIENTGIAYDPHDLELRRDPYPFWHRMRTQDPVHFSELLNAWLITRHQDACDLLRLPTLSKDLRNAPSNSLGSRGFMNPPEGKPPLIWLDPPDHTRLRGLINKAFTPRAIADLIPRIELIVSESLRSLSDSGPFDLMDGYAGLVPVRVIAEMLGVSNGNLAQFKTWANDYILGLDASSTTEMRASRDAAKSELINYFRGQIAFRRENDLPDILTGLVRAEEQGDKLNEGEMLSTCLMLLIAGIETTANLIGNSVFALLSNPKQAKIARDTVRLSTGMVDELLRYDSPVQVVQRVLTTTTVIGEYEIPTNSIILTMVGAVNRDPSVFKNPDTLDLLRQDVRHFSFGHGIHYCLGGSLARSVASVAIPALLRKYPNLKLSGASAQWRSSPIFRGLSRLPLLPGIGLGAR